MRFDEPVTLVYGGEKNALNEYSVLPEKKHTFCSLMFLDDKTQISAAGEDGAWDIRIRLPLPMKHPNEVILKSGVYRVKRNPHHLHTQTLYLQQKVNSDG